MQDELLTLTGMTVPEAVEWAKMRYHTIRIIRIDGEAQEVHTDANRTRINVEVTDGKIARVDGRY